jgi:hypothetical protein
MRRAAAKSAKPVAAPKPSTPARKPAALKWEKPAGFGGRRQTASLPGGRRVNVYSDGKGATASIFNERDRSPVMVRKDFRNVTEAKKWAANPSARGPRILGRYQPSGKRRKVWEMPTDASPSLANIQGKKARPSGTIVKPRGLKPGAIAARKAKAKPTKAERVIARIEGNQARGSTVARSKKEDRRLARTLAISQFAKSYVSERAVGNRDPNTQYKKADLLPQLNKALSRPSPKKQRKSTTRSNDPRKGLIALGVGAALKTRAKYRAAGRLLPARRSSRRPRKPKP